MSRTVPGLRAFMALVAALLIVAASFIGFRWPVSPPSAAEIEQTDELVNGFPLPFHSSAPWYTDLVTPDDLHKALCPLQPYWESWDAVGVLHAIRVWGVKARFADRAPFPVPKQVYTAHGPDLLRYFREERYFRTWYRHTPPYFYHTRFGVAARVANSSGANAHLDDFLAIAGELGLSSVLQFELAEGAFPLRELVRHSCAAYHPQQECEFTAVALGLYLKQPAVWLNRFGEQHAFRDIVQRLLAHDLTTGSCYAIHVPYALAVLLAADREAPFLTPTERSGIRVKLRNIADSLEENQGGAGYWNRSWIRSRWNAKRIEDEQVEWIRSTGHHLEWLALVDEGLRPSPQVMQKAIAYTVKTLQTWPARYLSQGHDYAALSHAGKALLLLTGHTYGDEVLPDTPPSAARNGAGK